MRPKIIFHEEAETVEIILFPVDAYDDSHMFGTHTLHFFEGNLCALEIHEADLEDGESDSPDTTIGVFNGAASTRPEAEDGEGVYEPDND